MSDKRISDLPPAPEIPTADDTRLVYEDKDRQNFYRTTIGDIVKAHREKTPMSDIYAFKPDVTPVYATGSDAIKVGAVLAVTAVDWAMHAEQTARDHAYRIITGTLYGEVVAVLDDGFALAPQVFHDGDVRCTLVVPFVCVKHVEVLKAAT